MKLIKSVKIVFISLTLFSSFYAQNFEPGFLQLPMDKGIAFNLTSDMIQDSKGFLWFCTKYGLERYDGVNFIPYKYNPEDSTSISSNDIISLFEDTKGNLWIGSRGGGLNKFDVVNNKFTHFLHNPNYIQSVTDDLIQSIAEDKKGKIWIGTNSHGLHSFDPASGLFKKTDLKLANSTSILPSINCMLADDNFLWVGHSKGLSKLNLQTGSVVQFDLKEENEKSAGPHFVHSIFKDSKGNLWIGTSSGLKKYDPNEQKFIQFDPDIKNSITSIAEDKRGFLWLGSNNGLIRLNKETGDYKKFIAGSDKNSIAGNFINKVLVDKSGLLWILSYNAGVTKVILTPPKFKRFPVETENSKIPFKENVLAITCDEKGNIYIGTYSNKLQIFNLTTEKTSEIILPEKESSEIHSLAINKNSLWIGTNRILLKYDLEKKRFENIILPKEEKKEIEGNIITAICFNTDSTLWIGTYNHGVLCYNLNQKALKYYSLADTQKSEQSNFIITIYADNKNNLWIGTLGGVYQLNPEGIITNSFVQRSDNPEELSNNYVYSILQDSNGDYWFGTASGLNKFDPKTKIFKHFYKKDGLPGDVIFGIVQENPETFWLSTNKGINRFNQEKNTFFNFDKEDGLQNDVFNPSVYFKSEDGTIYFGGTNGISYFSPGNLIFSKFNSPIVITSIKVNDQNGKMIEKNATLSQMDFGPNQNTVTIEFASLDFTNPVKNLYKYKLSDLSDEWISLGTKNFVTFTNLPQGDYTFELMGTNSDGVWSDKTASFSFSISSHLWQTWWFIPLLFLALILSLILVHILIVNHKVKNAVELIKSENKNYQIYRTKSENEFYDELAHSITRISLANEIVSKKIGMAFVEIIPLINDIALNSKRLYEELKDFIWAVDPGNDSLYNLMIKLKDYGDEVYGNTEIQFSTNELSENLKKARLNVDLRREVLTLFKEGINNSLKHFNCRKVSLISSVNVDDFEMILREDGLELKPGETLINTKIEEIIRKTENLIITLDDDSSTEGGISLTIKGRIQNK